MDAIAIRYELDFGPRVETFEFSLDNQSFVLANPAPATRPHWAELEFKQCSHCPLQSSEHSHCPLALHMVDVVDRLDDTRSIDEVTLRVVTEERTTVQTTQLQQALSSMLSLVAATCGCPKGEKLRPLARFHLPLATEEESAYQASGMFLLAQFLLQSNGHGGKFDFTELGKIYEELHVVYRAIANRIQFATESDSFKNAIALQDMHATLIPLLLDDQLDEIRGLFNAYLPKDAPMTEKSGNNYLEKARAFSLELAADTELSLISGDDEDASPAWLTERAPEAEDSRVDDILKNSSLTLSLEGEPAVERPSGRAVFILPDD